MRTKILGLLAVGLLVGPVTANAGYILDTGTPAGGDYSIGFYNVDCCFQHLGVTFNVASASRISSVEAWILPFDSGDVSFGLRAGNAPTGDLIFSTAVTIDGAAAEGWHGATNLDWDVAAGDYTLTLIALYGFNGVMPITPPFPAGDEWFDNRGEWLTLGSDNLGWRIGAEPSSVAEPGTLALLGLGLAGLGFSAARRQRAK